MMNKNEHIADYVAVLESLFEAVSKNEDGILNCWSPSESLDYWGEAQELPCLECAPCKLTDALSNVEIWLAEHEHSDGLVPHE